MSASLSLLLGSARNSVLGFTETFTGADATDLATLGFTETSSGANAANWTIVGNKASCSIASPDYGYATKAAGISNYTVSVAITDGTYAFDYPALVVRWTDINNYVTVTAHDGTGTVKIGQTAGGVSTLDYNTGVSFGANPVLGAVCSGTSVQATLNGSNIGAAQTVTVTTANVGMGVNNGSADTYFDNLTVAP